MLSCEFLLSISIRLFIPVARKLFIIFLVIKDVSKYIRYLELIFSQSNNLMLFYKYMLSKTRLQLWIWLTARLSVTQWSLIYAVIIVSSNINFTTSKLYFKFSVGGYLLTRACTGPNGISASHLTRIFLQIALGTSGHFLPFGDDVMSSDVNCYKLFLDLIVI